MQLHSLLDTPLKSPYTMPSARYPSLNSPTDFADEPYKAFEPPVARALLNKLEFKYTPKHGSWLNIAECEFSVLTRQCFDRRLPDMETVEQEVKAWTEMRNQAGATVNWRFTTQDARIKLKQLYPTILK